MMAKGRMLKKEISSSKKLGSLKSDSERLLYTWLIPWLDIEGRYTADPDLLKGHIFPKVKSMTTGKIKKLLVELAQDKLIYYYQFEGEHYLQFIKFKDMQSLNPDREARSEIPPFNKKSCELLITPEDSPSKIKSKIREVKSNIYTQIFLEFYSHYPKKVGKKVAFIAWKQHPKKNHTELIQASRNYWSVCEYKKTDPEFIKDPSGFLNKSKEYWKDYLNITLPKKIGENQKLTAKEMEANNKYVNARIKKEKELEKDLSHLDLEERGHIIRLKLAKWTEGYYGEENKNEK